MKVYTQSVKAKAIRYAHTIAIEAAELFRRRKFSYAALAVTLTAGSLYISGVRPVLAQNAGQFPMPTTDERDNSSQVVPLQTVTGQDPNQTNRSVSSPDVTTTSGLHTTVTVNGTDVPVPATGETHTTMTSNNGTTSISVSHDSSGDNSSSLDVQVFSQSTASQEGN